MARNSLNEMEISGVKALSGKALAPWLKDACIDWAIIGLAFAGLHFGGWVFLLPALLVIGNRQHALTVLGHEGAHFSLSSSRKTNDFISNLLAFWPLGITVSGYRNVHFKHHKSTNMEGDPELAHRGARAPQWDLPVSIRKIAEYCLSDLVGGSLSDYVIIVTFSKPDKRSEYIPLLAVHAAFIAGCFASGALWVAAVWYLSLVTSFMMFFRLRTFLEHLGTDDTHRVHLNVWQRHLLAPHNIWYHWEHHSFPMISYHYLPKLRALVARKPVITLPELLRVYANSPHIASGQVLKHPQESSRQFEEAA